MQLVFHLRTSKLPRIDESKDSSEQSGEMCPEFPFITTPEDGAKIGTGVGRAEVAGTDLHRLTVEFCRQLYALPYPIRY